MDGESWQMNLESWRERRRAATRALTLEIQQHCPPSPQPQGNIESIIQIPTLSNSEVDIRKNLEKLKAPEKSISDVANRFTPKNDAKSVSSGIVKNSLFLLSDAERVKQRTNSTAEKRSPPIRIRLVCDPDCVKADNLGLTIAALGDNDGPPFVIRDLVKGTYSSRGSNQRCGVNQAIAVEGWHVDNRIFPMRPEQASGSMAERGNLQVGDELFSVDNLCCTFASDRPILISTLTKLHQLLQRLTIKQRPVEVKVLRDNECDGERKPTLVADRLRANGEPTIELKKDAHSSDGLPYSRFDEGKTAENGASGSGGIALIELEKAHPIKALERVLPASEQVELKYADRNLGPSISSPRLELASTVSTTRSDYETTNILIQPITAAFAEKVNIRQNGLDDVDEHESNFQRNFDRTPSTLYSNHSEEHSLTFEESILPPPPAPISSDSLAATPSETPPSIDAIQPPPTPSAMESSIMERHSSNSLVLSPPPPPSPPPISLIADPPSNHHSNAQQNQYVKDKMIITQTPKHPSLPTKASSSDDLLRSDVITNNRGHVQYDSYAVSDDTRAYVNSSPSVECGWRSELNIPYSGTQRQPNISSDIDSDVEPQNQLNKPGVRQVKIEPIVEAKQPTEEPESRLQSSLKSNEKMLTFSGRETQYFPRPVTSNERPEMRMAESVTLSPLQSVESRSELSQSKTIRQIEYSPIDAAVKRSEEEIEHRPNKKARSNSKRVPSDPVLRQQNLPSTRPPRVNVIGTWYTCAGCNQQLGSSDLMIIEQLNLFYHLSCFVCARCGIQLSDGQNETSVRISNGLIYCYICYHRLRKPLSNKDKNKPRTPERNEQHSSLSRTAATAGPLMNTSSSYQTSNYRKSIKR